MFLIEQAFLYDIVITVVRSEQGKCFHLPVSDLFKLTKYFTLSSKQNQNQSHLVRAIFPARVSKLRVIPWNSDWFIVLFAPVVIGRSNYFGSGFRQSFENRFMYKPIPLLL